MTERFYEHTHIYAIEEEFDNMSVYVWNEEFWKQKKEELDSYLRNDLDRDKVIALYHDEDFYRRSYYNSDFAEFMMAMEIFEDEQLYEEPNPVLNGCHSVKEISAKLAEIKFALFRIEFIGDAETYQHLLDIIEEYRISATCLRKMVGYISYDKMKIALQLSKFFVQMQMVRYAQALLEAAKETNGENK